MRILYDNVCLKFPFYHEKIIVQIGLHDFSRHKKLMKRVMIPVLIRSANMAPMIGTMRAKPPILAVCIMLSSGNLC